ncbi:unnamed protein product, partial [Sphacelaria rigidula]
VSTADFFSWLRKLPEESLEAAGLLVSPRTALNKTEAAMSKSEIEARELSNTLEASINSTVGILQATLESVTEKAAIDRVRLGWGEQDDEGAERMWQKHTGSLQRDVDTLQKALSALRDEVAHEAEVVSGDADEMRRRTSTARTNGEHTPEAHPVDRGHCIDECDNKNVAGRSTHSVFQPRQVEGHADSGAGLVVIARQIGQQVAKLALAAEHLKEALRCVEDAELRKQQQASQFKHHRRRSSRSGLLIHGLKCPISPTADIHRSSKYLTDRCQRGTSACQGQGSFDSRRGNTPEVLRQHVMLVKRLQTEISQMGRHTRILCKNEEDRTHASNMPKPMSENGNKKDFIKRYLDDTAPRSALALVKRIRRAQEAFERPANNPLTPDNAVANMEVPPADSQGAVQDQHANVGDHRTWTTRQRESGVDPPDHAGCAAAAVTTGIVPYRGRFRPSCLRRINERLELLRSAFDTDGEVDLPSSVANATPEFVVDLGNRGGSLAGDGNVVGTEPPPAVVTCWPIDRFALHVFCTTGVAACADSAFMNVQELAGSGGLNTHVSGSRLWVAAARAGIVDVERWIAGAVLWQIVEAVEEGIEGRSGAALDTMVVHDETRAAGSRQGNDISATLSAATSLWANLRSEAFGLVLGRRTGNTNISGNTKINDDEVSSRGDNCTTTSKRPLSTQNMLSCADPSQTPPYRCAINSRPDSFDRALLQALPRVAATGAEVLVSAQLPSQKTGTSVACSTFSVEEALLFAFANSGFEEKSSLTVSDIVQAVKLRRQRRETVMRARDLTSVPWNIGPAKNDRLGDTRDERLGNEQDREAPQPNLSELLSAALIAQWFRKSFSVRKRVELRLVSSTACSVLPCLIRLHAHAALRCNCNIDRQQAATTESKVQEAEAELVRTLDANRALESAQFEGGKTALHHAAMRGDAHLVQLLLERGAKVHIK